ncbi:hypothetical protein GCM10010413_15430 [Promicromonospora sukumoe]|uniref:Uncharacterized protein n=1 Tax=Promicromonospora sukumoe TaxID=88382 RepID=A0A7W3PEY4_9MICO|nr:hypothetical protein [Promicromonospora sukumoe]MBA8809231.1 hypothetical protein [Promicromonospora sukumoe]
MNQAIQLISDGGGLAVIGNAEAVERFLSAEGLPSQDLGLQRLGPRLGAAAGITQTGSDLAASSGRWVKLSKESAQLVDKWGLRTSSKTGLSSGVLKGPSGQVKGFVEFAAKGPGALLTNPAVLAGAAGIMAQLAMQQAMEEITDYLAAIDAKVDDILRAQKDAALAEMVGADLVIEEAMTIREHVGRVSEVTWSKVQATPMTIAQTQAYALRRIDALAEKLEHKSSIGDLATASRDAESTVREWLAVLARCFQLQEAIGVLELDRVLDTSPEELDSHRIALKVARGKRLELISHSTARLLARIDRAAGTANSKVLLHPTSSRAVVQAGNHVATAVVDFHGRLGIDDDRQALEARRWVDAVTEVKDMALQTGAEGIDAARRVGNGTVDRARSVTDRLSGEIATRALRRRGNNEETR